MKRTLLATLAACMAGTTSVAAKAQDCEGFPGWADVHTSIDWATAGVPSATGLHVFGHIVAENRSARELSINGSARLQLTNERWKRPRLVTVFVSAKVPPRSSVNQARDGVYSKLDGSRFVSARKDDQLEIDVKLVERKLICFLD
jgi:hypothetical protein